MYYRVGPIRCRILSAGVQPIRALLVQGRHMSRLEAARILGIEPSASEKEIKNAYIKLAKIHHPVSQTGCETKFRQLQTASVVLQKLHSKAENDFYRGEAARAQRRDQKAKNSSSNTDHDVISLLFYVRCYSLLFYAFYFLLCVF